MDPVPRKIKIGRFEFALPASRVARTVIGFALVVFGIFGFLPVVGFWMIPLGLLVLSFDWAFARRLRRRLSVWIARRGRSEQ